MLLRVLGLVPRAIKIASHGLSPAESLELGFQVLDSTVPLDPLLPPRHCPRRIAAHFDTYLQVESHLWSFRDNAVKAEMEMR